MPTYPVINKETGEKKELSMTMIKYDEWRKDNPDWDRDWNAGVAGLGEVERSRRSKRKHRRIQSWSAIKTKNIGV